MCAIQWMKAMRANGVYEEALIQDISIWVELMERLYAPKSCTKEICLQAPW